MGSLSRQSNDDKAMTHTQAETENPLDTRSSLQRLVTPFQKSGANRRHARRSKNRSSQF
jgi:hypothetical protein